jgi:hypothetical protein
MRKIGYRAKNSLAALPTPFGPESSLTKGFCLNVLAPLQVECGELYLYFVWTEKRTAAA